MVDIFIISKQLQQVSTTKFIPGYVVEVMYREPPTVIEVCNMYS